jgi:HEAT repeat protein
MRRVVVALACATGVALVAAGCEGVSSESIQRWKTTQKGPGKIADALKDSSVPPALRAEAAAAMVDMGNADEAEQILARTPAAERWEILKTLVPLYGERMKDPDVPRSRAARDALFAVREYAPPEERKQIDAQLIPAIAKDVREGRLSGGRHSLEKMVEAIGPPIAPTLLALLEDPKVPFGAAAELLGRVADQPTRDRASAALVQRAVASREIPVVLWRALGTMGGRAATNFLAQKVEKGFERDAIAAAQALQQRRDPSVLPLALRLAADPKVNKTVRDEMFGLTERIGGGEAQRGLLRIIASDPSEVVRYRAYEAALAVGGGEALVPALEAFPPGATYKKDDVVDFLVKDVTKIGPPARPAVLKALTSRATLARMTGVLALEAPLAADAGKSPGGPADPVALAALTGLASDRATLKGFPAGDTVGKEAARVAAALQKKR